MKKIFTLIFVALLPLVASAYDAQIDGIYYNFSDDEAEVTDGDTKYTGSVIIPETVTYNGKTYSVTSIGEDAFYAPYNSYGLTSINIPESVTSIGEGAFAWCTSLTSITIPNSVTSIGNYAFLECSGLISIQVERGNTVYDSRNNCNAIIETVSNTLIAGCRNTVIPNSVTSIGDFAFMGCSSLTSITIPEGVTSIGISAFDGCSGLTSITIPNSVTSIAEIAFENCRGLTEITIGNGVTSIGSGVFDGCSGLTSIIVESVNAVYDSRNNCNAIIETATNTLIVGCKNTIIPNSVTSIGGGAFYDCSGLTSVTIPNSVTTIGSSAFSRCSSLTSVTIPNSVTSIGSYAFDSCSSLTSVTIPNSVTSIGSSAFYGCSSLTSITIPESVTSIGEYAFSGTTWYNNQPDGLVYAGKVAYKYKGTMPEETHITIEDGTLGITGDAFSHCSGLTSVTISSSVTNIGRDAFLFCSGLTTIDSYINEPFACSGAFRLINEAAKLIVPQGTRDAYLAAGWTEDVFPGGVVERTGGMEILVTVVDYATIYCAESDLAIPEGIQAFTGVVNGEWVNLKEVTGKIPACTAVILKGEEGTYRFAYTTGAEPVSENDLKGTDEPLVADGTQYILGKKQVYGFFKATPGTTIPAGKAYIETTAQSVKGFCFYEDDATSINEEVRTKEDLYEGAIYNLAGQRKNKIQQGLNIVNGKKVLR